MTTDDHRTTTERTDEVEHGPDAGDFHEFIEWVEANPDDAILRERAVLFSPHAGRVRGVVHSPCSSSQRAQ